MKVTKNLEKSTTEPGLKNEKINSTENENNTLSFHKEPEKSFTSKKSVKSHIPLVPYLVDEDSDTSTIRTSPDSSRFDDQSGEEINISYVKRKRKRKSDQNNFLLEGSNCSIDNNDSSNSASSSTTDDLGKGKRKRFKNVRMLDIEDVVNKSPNKKKV